MTTTTPTSDQQRAELVGKGANLPQVSAALAAFNAAHARIPQMRSFTFAPVKFSTSSNA
ncbi:hypothetical protein [Nocardioides montaniterrae]